MYQVGKKKGQNEKDDKPHQREVLEAYSRLECLPSERCELTDRYL